MSRCLPILLCVVMTACSGDLDVSIQADEIGVLPLENYRVNGLAVAGDGSIVIGMRTDPESGSRGVLAVLTDGSTELNPLPLPERDACRVTDYLRPQSLPDGRVGAVRKYRSDCGNDELVAIDPQSHEVEVLAEADQPAGWYAWTAELDLAVVERGSDLCGGLGGLRPGAAIEALPMDVIGERQSFLMSDAWASASGEGCDATGWARWPSISGDGRLAFFAAPGAAGTAGPDRALSPAQLYIGKPLAAEATTVGPFVVLPRALSWSPDDHALAFAGAIDGVEGTWLWRLDEARAVRVYDQAAIWLAWEPDGQGLVTVMWADPSDPLSHAKIVRIRWEEGD